MEPTGHPPVMISVLLLIAPLQAPSELELLNACLSQAVDKYAVLDEPATVIVQTARATCQAQERALINVRVAEFRRENPTIPEPSVRRTAEEAIGDGTNRKLLQWVMDAKLARERP